MDIELVPMTNGDREQVVDIFNYYVENTFAAFPEQKLPYAFFDAMFEKTNDYPAVTAKDKKGVVLGFGMLRPHNPFPTFSSIAEITYFLKPQVTRKGIGTKMLEYLEARARKKRIATILAPISSLNQGSIAFHAKNGFKECGRIKQAVIKKGKTFDVVLMQKML